VAVIVLALTKGLLWAVTIPGWYGPDEPSHFAYIQGIVEDHMIPIRPDVNASLYYPFEIGCSENRLGIGPLGPFHAEPPFGATGSNCSQSATSSRHASAPVNAAASYDPIYYLGAVPFYLLATSQVVETRLAATRLWSVLLGVLSAVLAFLAFRLAFEESTGTALAATVLFILQPMNSQQTAVINNDALLIALAAAFWWRFYHSIRYGVTLRNAILLGLLVGLAYLAKPQGLFLAATLPVLFALTIRRDSLGVTIRGVARLTAASAAPVIGALALGQLVSVLAGRTSLLIPSAPGLHGVQQYLQAYGANHLERVYTVFVAGFWGNFGWNQVSLPDSLYVLIVFLTVIGLVGCGRLLLRPLSLRSLVVSSAVGVLVAAALIQLLELYAFRISGSLILQGRSFLMLLIPVIVLLLLGWQRLLPRAAGWGLAPATVMLALTLNLVSLARMVDVFYG